MSDTTPTHDTGTAATATLTEPAPVTPQPTEPVDRGGVNLPSKVKNAIVAGGVGIAVLAGLLGFGAGYIVGDNSSSNSNQMNGPGGRGGMNGQMGPGGMNGQMGPGQMPNGQMGPGQMPNGQQSGGQNQPQAPTAAN
ncbi:hypothetical protein [Gordonia sp. ABSL49_1]|uniref:hypothetical protein n=1 Tax=Gordonia sp. ABSL49_1 TaxID=2920941 RepID=UPI001F11697C|nr:hypothetical protein [Gordonia sp. ABSL49_1]MCH5644067.1 hypothetical protein [Gordonia sp. ABSL49_1]